MGIYNLGGGGGGTSELQAKEATPLITNAQQIILPDEGYDGLSKVTVNPMPTGTLKTPTVNSIGYVSAGVQTAGYLNTSATSGLQLSTQAAKTITPTTYSQTAVASGKYTTGAVTVGAVSLQSKTVSPSSSSQTVKPDSGYTGLSQVTVNGVALQNKTVTPSSATQYISADSGYYGLDTVTVNRLNTTMTTATLQQTETGLTLSFPSSIASAVAVVATGICLAYVGSGQVQFPYVITHYVGGFGRISIPVGNFITNYSINGNVLSGYIAGATFPIYPMVSNTLDAWILA